MLHKRFTLLVILLIASVVLAACPQPAPVAPGAAPAPGAEETGEEAVEPSAEVQGQPGGIFIEGTSDDPSILNPVISSGTNSSDVENKIYPTLIGQDPFTGELIPSELAESWEVSDDGLVWTFNMRDDIFWSDGEPVTANDVKFTFDAIASEEVESPRKYITDAFASVEAPDAQTLVITYNSLRCDALAQLGLNIIPSHKYAADFSDIMTSAENEAPTVSAGPVIFNDWIRDERVTTLSNPDYFKGAPNMEGWIYKEVPDAGARLAQLQTGEVNKVDLQPEQVAAANLDPNLNVLEYQDDGFTYISLNLANPANPLPGLDEEGNPVEQDPHPVLGDKRVRQAIAYALDYDTIIDQVFLGQGYRMVADVLPAIEWAYNDELEPYPYNTEVAVQLLEEAGWVDEDGDGVREKDGVPMSLTLITNAGNSTREDLGVLVQDQLNSIGFDITFEAIEFGTLLEEMDNQVYDMIIIGWTNLGAEPHYIESFWRREYDVPGSGFNSGSFASERMEEVLNQGVSVPGCAVEERAPFYKEAQEIIHEEVPYVIVSGRVGTYGYTNDWQGLNPGPWSFYHNMEQWTHVP